jgi:hypothetical protein
VSGQAKGDREPSIVASSRDQAERLGLEPDEVDDYVKHVAVAIFGGKPLVSAP